MLPRRGMPILLFACGLVLVAEATAGELPDFKNIQIKGLTHTAIGVTRRDTPIAAYVSSEDTNYSTKKCRILLIGGLDGDRQSVDAVLEVLKWFQTHEDAGAYRELMALSAVPCVYPDSLAAAGAVPVESFPPEGKFYQSGTDVEGQYVWNWVRFHCPDIVVDVRQGKTSELRVPFTLDRPWVKAIATEQRLGPQAEAPPASLVAALGKGERMGIGITVTDDDAALLRQFLHRQAVGLLPVPSQARKERIAVLKAPVEPLVRDIAIRQIKRPPGRNYYDTLPLLATHRLSVRGMDFRGVDLPAVAPWEGDQPPKSGSEIAGLYAVNGWPYGVRDKVRAAADQSLDKDGKPLAEPLFHSQMSDAVFMNGPLLAGAGYFMKERKYLDACAQHVNFTLKLCKRDDGLYRHSPLCEAAWGRGNGFVAMGLALVLEDFPAEHPERAGLLKAYQEHLAALKKHQDYTGCWHQVIDHPESYREFTCTCMIGFAMASGIRHGWLEKEFQPCVDKAWQAAIVRTTRDGFMDVCTGTGKQKTLRDYLDREALSGPDARAASMFLMFASEQLKN